jgi:predicted nucleic-acid-binding protein
MIGLDTNILIRYFIQDDPAQSKKATEIIERSLSPENPGFVSIVTMAELAWVLGRTYGFSGVETAEAIERIIGADLLIIEHEREVEAAMAIAKNGLGSFADALIAALGQRAGCTHTVTFDRKAARLPGFELA